MERNEAILLRADLLKTVKGLELQRAGILSFIGRLEKTYHIEPKKGNGSGNSTEGFTQYSQDEGGAYPQSGRQDSL